MDVSNKVPTDPPGAITPDTVVQVEIPRAVFVDQEVDMEVLDLEQALSATTFTESDPREMGAQAYVSGLTLEDIEAGPDALYRSATKELEELVKHKQEFLKERIKANNDKLSEFASRRNELIEVRKSAEQARLAQLSTEVDATEIANKIRILTLSKLAEQQARVKSQAPPPPPPADQPTPKKLFVLDETLKNVPDNENEAQLAYLWKRVLQWRSDYESLQTLLIGLEQRGLTFLLARSLVVAGTTVMLGAGGAVGALLQDSDIGNHLVERILFSIQSKLGFVSGHEPAGLLNGTLQGLVIGLLGIFALMVLVWGVLKLTSKIGRSLEIQVDEESGEDAELLIRRSIDSTVQSGVAADANVWARLGLKSIVYGPAMIVRLLSALVLALIGLLVFLAFGPSFAPDKLTSLGFSVTKTSIGFVVALAVGLLAHVAFLFGIFPDIRRRVLDGETLGLVGPRAAVVCLLVFVGLGTLVISSGPIFKPSSSQIATPSSQPSQGSNQLQSPDTRRAAVTLLQPSIAGWPQRLVWFAVTMLLLLSSGVLALGNTVLDLHRTANRTRAKLFEYEERFAQKIRLVRPPPASILLSPTTSTLPDDVKSWPIKTETTEILHRAATSGLLSDADLGALAAAQEAAQAAVRNRQQSDSNLRQLDLDLADVESKIRSRELSNNNYENRISKILQQAASARVNMHARFVKVLFLIAEGYHIAQRAYPNQKADSASTGK